MDSPRMWGGPAVSWAVLVRREKRHPERHRPTTTVGSAPSTTPADRAPVEPS